MLKKTFMAVVTVALVGLSAQAMAAAKAQGVYVKVIEGMKADAVQTAAKAEALLKEAGFTVLASYENGAPEGCGFKAVTVVFAREAYSSKILSGGPDKAFALPLRLSVYEDESGVGVVMLNPVSVNRTVFQGNSMDEPAQKVVDEAVAALKALGPVSPRQAGQMRDSGKIPGMGGGAFPEKIVSVVSSRMSVADAASAVLKGVADKSGWHSVYEYSPSADVAIVGLTNRKTEGRAFGIAGEKKASKASRFPGLDHAPAFPIEAVVYKKGGVTDVVILKEMWRMKLYFEDAGMWAFTKNMAMPGQIQDEIDATVKKAVK